MDGVAIRGWREEQREMAFHLTTEGVVAEVTPDNRDHGNHRVIASRGEWEAVAGEWPLKRLVAFWNSLPGVIPVDKFTSRQIAVERIWRAVQSAEQTRQNAMAKAEKPKVQFREGSKAAQAYALLCRSEGVTLRELQDLTGWQRHTVRGFLSASVRKQGSRVRSFQRAGERVYRVRN
jgi:hypothetical protein